MNASRAPRVATRATASARVKDGAAEQRRGSKDSRKAGGAATAVSPPNGHDSFHVVGIGASAGGLSAVGELLANLPVDTGMAFVVYQHLDPDHKSELTDLLKKVSRLPVEEVSANLRVQPNRVYVIPADHSLSFDHGILMLKSRARVPAVYRAIDAFLESLAADRGPLAIGVVLSGTGHDGALGLEAIKAAEGVTFAQDHSAKYDSMPRSAIEAGSVDYVLAPAAIAQEIGRMAGGSGSRAVRQPAKAGRGPKGSRVTDDALKYTRIRHLLHKHSGVDFTGYKPTTFMRRVSRRISLSKLAGLAEYTRLLEKSGPELDLLFSDVLIHVTSFFRNPESFEFLKKKVMPKLLDARRGDMVRIWSLGCSTGQEAYSLAMAFTEAADRVPGAPPFQIFASDLNPAVLEQARAGLYAKSVMANVSPERLARFFTTDHGGYRVTKPLRDCVVFAHQNVLRDPPFSRLDLIVCRNMLIYLEPGVQEKLLPTFHYALKPDGFLFLGSAETANGVPKLFEPLHKKHRIFARRAGASGATLVGRPKSAVSKQAPVSLLPVAPVANSQVEVLRESERLTLNRFAPAGVLVDAAWHVLHFRGDTSPWLRSPAGKARFELLEMAREGLRSPLHGALLQAKKSGGAVRVEGVAVGAGDESRLVNLEVLPVKHTQERCYLVFFITAEAVALRRRGARPLRHVPARRPAGGKKGGARREIETVERELADARDYLQSFQQQAESTNEALQASNEEVTSANEELQSLNEELETSKEEVESANEELVTVNEEMAVRNLELTHLNSDLTNLQGSTRLAIVLLGPDRRIRRFTEEAARQFDLRPSDLGRSFEHARHNLEVPDLDAIIDGVIESRNEYEREVRNKDGRWSLLRVRPYLTFEQKIDGAVLVVVDIEAIKQSEQRAKAALDYAQSTVDTVRTPILVLDGELKITSANLAFYRLFQVSPAETVGQPFHSLGSGDWAGPRVRSLLESILPQRMSFRDFEIEHEIKHLGRRILLLDGGRMENPANRSERILLAIQDVTQRRAEEAELQENREQFARIFNQTAAGIAQTNADGQFTLVNDRFCQIVGRTRKELLTLRTHELLHPDDVEQNARFVGELLAGALHEFVIEKRYLRPDGSIVWVHNEVAPIRAPDNRVHSVVAVVTDITQRRQNEAALRYQALLLRTLSETAAQLLTAESPQTFLDVIFSRLAHVLGAEYYFVHLLDEARKKLVLESSMGLDAPQQALLGELAFDGNSAVPFSGVVDPHARDDAASPADGREAAVRSLGTRTYACHPLSVGAHLLGTLSVASAKRDRFDPDELRFIHAICDLVATSLERARLTHEVGEARDVAERANVAKDNFFAALSHELRTPLSPVILIAGMGAGNPELPAKVRHDFTTIEKNVLMEARLIDDLLDLTRIAHGKLTIKQAPVDIRPILQDAIDTVRPEIDAKRLKLDVRLATGEHIVSGDAVRLQQIFWNILRNAAKFTPVEGSITIETAVASSGRLAVKFVDTGMGMSGEELKRIFEAFSQGDHAGPDGSRRFGGVGLGLSISRMLAELHRGTLRAESAGKNAGSTFVVELPLAPETNSADSATSAQLATAAGAISAEGETPRAPCRVLLVEDHHPTRGALSRLLANRGYVVTAAASLAEARQAAGTKSFDLLISDIGLPDGSGHDLMREMRDRFATKGLALTGYGMEDDIARAKAAGFAAHLIKPISVAALEVALKTMLEAT